MVCYVVKAAGISEPLRRPAKRSPMRCCVLCCVSKDEAASSKQFDCHENETTLCWQLGLICW